MQGGFFLLLRFFMRVDGVLIRINDTRIYHKVKISKMKLCMCHHSDGYITGFENTNPKVTTTWDYTQSKSCVHVKKNQACTHKILHSIPLESTA